MTDASSRPARIPAVRGIEHIGLTVPNLDQATRFFVDLLGAVPLYDIGPLPSADDWMATHLTVDPRARIHRLRVLEVADGPVLELFELAGADGSAKGGDTSWHIAFYVDDMEGALAALKTHGVAIQSGPVTMTEGPSAGLTWLYFQAPWGQQLELVSYPGGIRAYRDRPRPVWRPAPQVR